MGQEEQVGREGQGQGDAKNKEVVEKRQGDKKTRRRGKRDRNDKEVVDKEVGDTGQEDKRQGDKWDRRDKGKVRRGTRKW